MHGGNSPYPTPQIEGRGNGIKTNVVNNVEVAKALERPADCAPPWALCTCQLSDDGCLMCCSPFAPVPLTTVRSPADIVKWYGCELGAQTKFDKKTGTSIVNGAHDTGKLVELLEVASYHICIYICYRNVWCISSHRRLELVCLA